MCIAIASLVDLLPRAGPGPRLPNLGLVFSQPRALLSSTPFSYVNPCI
jgi:hypothetical protein